MRIRKFQGFLVAAPLLAALILLQSATIEGAGECNSNPCLYGSTCEPTTNGYTCACVDHTTGIHCETVIDDCTSASCEGGGTCEMVTTPEVQVKCNCPAGRQGNRCEQDIDECQNNPCGIGGDCNNLDNRYTCTCKPGYTGAKCEEIQECSSAPCRNGGTCEDKINKYTCKCTKDFVGTNCEKKKPTAYPHSFPTSPPNRDQGVLPQMADSDEYVNSERARIYKINFPYFGKNYRKIFVHDMGFVSFGTRYFGKRDPLDDPPETPALVYGLFSEIDTSKPKPRATGQSMISYNTCNFLSKDAQCTETMQRSKHDVALYYNAFFNNGCLNDFTPIWTLVVTYSRVSYRGGLDKTPPQESTFQIILTTDGTYSFVMYNYINTNWPKGTAPPCTMGWSRNSTKYYLERGRDCNTLGESTQGSRGADIPVGFRIYRLDHDDEDKKCYEKGPEAQCMEWVGKQKVFSNNEIGFFNNRLNDPGCPCTRFGALFSWWYSFFVWGGRNLEGNPEATQWILNLRPSSSSSQMSCIRTMLRGGAFSRVCCYRNNRLVTFNSRGGYLVRHDTLPLTRAQYDLDFVADGKAKDACCLRSQLCGEFYTYREVNFLSATCRRRWIPIFAIFWGDPHIQTLDLLPYTFNGLGEYTIVKTDEASPEQKNRFQLQGRTKLVGNATGWSAIAVRDIGSRRVQVELDPTSDKMKVFITKSSTSNMNTFADSVEITDKVYTILDNTALQTGYPIETYNDGYGPNKFLPIRIMKNDSRSFIVHFGGSSFGVAFGVQGSGSNRVLQGTVSPNAVYKGTKGDPNTWKLKGLYGNFDGDADNDLVPPGTQTPLPASANQSQIFYEFGQKWKIKREESIFFYRDTESWSTYNSNNHVPAFLEDLKIQDQAKYKEAIAKCNNDESNKFCIYDYMVTGSASFAQSTLTSKTDIEQREKTLANDPPLIKVFAKGAEIDNPANYTGYRMQLGDTMTLTVEAEDPDSDIDDLFLDSGDALKNAGVTFTKTFNNNKKITGQFSWKVPDLSVETLRLFVAFGAKDKAGGESSTFTVPIDICACTNPDPTKPAPPCDWQQQLPEPEGGRSEFEVFNCICDAGWEGSQCNIDRNGCTQDTCKTGADCVNLTPAQEKAKGTPYVCLSCKPGFEVTGGNTVCTDIDECQNAKTAGKTLCDTSSTTTCTNTFGNYTCPCKTGYSADSADLTKCKDKDECENKADNNCEQICTNTPGSYSCSCQPGYTLGSNGACTQDGDIQTACAALRCLDLCIKDTSAPTGVKCACKQGFELDSNGIQCKDKDECLAKPCSQVCTNKLNGEGYSCGCNDGYKLDTDGKSCKECTGQNYGKECAKECQCKNSNYQCDRVKGCVCKASFTGNDCQTDVNECTTNPCGTGKCTNTIGSYTCTCPENFAFVSGTCESTLGQVQGGLDFWEILTIGLAAVLFLIIIAAIAICYVIMQRTRRLKQQQRLREDDTFSESQESMYVPAQWRLPMEGEYNPSGLRWMPINDGMAVFDEEYDDRMTQVPPSEYVVYQ